jgi:hypothetical protein
MITSLLPYPVLNEGKFGYNPDLSKQDPGSLYHLVYALAQHTGQSPYLLSQFFDINVALKLHKPSNLIVQAESLRYHPDGRRQIKGGVHVLTDGGLMVRLDSHFEYIYCYHLRLPQSFHYTVQALVKPAGTYKECLGGGWSSTIPLVEFLGNYYAVDQELSSGVRWQVQHALGLTREQATFGQ